MKGLTGALLTEQKTKGSWAIICRNPEGIIKWVEPIGNLITKEGLDYSLNSGLGAGTQVTVWYIGLTDASPTVNADDVMSSHVGWNEFVAYSQANRVTWIEANALNQSITNSASKAVFGVNADSSVIGGAFLVSVNTKSGITGVLFSVGAFTVGNKNADAGDTLEVTAEFTAAST